MHLLGREWWSGLRNNMNTLKIVKLKLKRDRITISLSGTAVKSDFQKIPDTINAYISHH